jgi:hypothetical protein
MRGRWGDIRDRYALATSSIQAVGNAWPERLSLSEIPRKSNCGCEDADARIKPEHDDGGGSTPKCGDERLDGAGTAAYLTRGSVGASVSAERAAPATGYATTQTYPFSVWQADTDAGEGIRHE